MDDWRLEPAKDMDLKGIDRYRSWNREGGLWESGCRLAWWLMLRSFLKTWNRLKVIGQERVPSQGSMIVIANHASHLDALLLTTIMPLSRRDEVYPIAAQDVFFEKLSIAAFAATFINAFPIKRNASSLRRLAELRQKLLDGPIALILFPEGTRTRTGSMGPFKTGIGMLVAGTSIPVIPCFIEGAGRAMSVSAKFVRPERITIRVGQPMTFAELTDDRDGWHKTTQLLESAVRELGKEPAASQPANASA
ncbi:MAG: lysophospholipid acyltransferase family protein [Pirellulales bacterium]